MPIVLSRLIVALALVAGALFGVFIITDRMAMDQRAERRALIERDQALTAQALAPGSALGCLDAVAGDMTVTACEAAIFASPQSTAAAAAYVGARLSLITDAKGDPELAARLSATRRAIELDRFGIAAQVLSQRDGCTAAQCAAFALVGDANLLKANMKAQAFDQYVSRHAAAWNATPAPQGAPAMSQAPASVAPVATPSGQPSSGQPLNAKYDFPSAASIPPVSIMNAEPALPKGATDAQAAAPKASEKAPERTPVPPRRPQAANEPADTAPAR